MVRDVDYNATSCFEINANDGHIRLIRELDREKAETIRLAIRVEDIAGVTPDQTASGKEISFLFIFAPVWQLPDKSTVKVDPMGP